MASWKETNVNVGFLVAIAVGFIAMVGIVEGFRHWVDTRIGVGIGPVVAQISTLDRQLETLEARMDARMDSDDRRRNQQFGQMRQDICLLARSLDASCAAGVTPSDAP